MYRYIFRIISLYTGVLLISGCATEKGHWECLVYDPQTKTVMTEEQYEQWTKDNNIDYVAPQNAYRTPSSHPIVIERHQTIEPVIRRVPDQVVLNRYRQYILDSLASKRRKSSPAPSSGGRAPSANTGNNEGTNGNRSTAPAQPAPDQPAQPAAPAQSAQPLQTQPASTTVAQGQTWEEIYNSAVQGNPHFQYVLGLSLVKSGGQKIILPGLNGLGSRPCRDISRQGMF